MHRCRAKRGDVVLVLQDAFDEQERRLDDDGAIPCEQRSRANRSDRTMMLAMPDFVLECQEDESFAVLGR